MRTVSRRPNDRAPVRMSELSVLPISFELTTPRSTTQSRPVGHPLLERLSSPLVCTGVGSAARAGGRTVAKTIALQ